MQLNHYNFHKNIEVLSDDYLKFEEPVKIILTSGASCPDAIVEEVMNKIASYFENIRNINDVLNDITEDYIKYK